jgi:hypothetical protein
MHFSHDLRWFCWRTQIKACLYAKNRHKGTDFVELVYNSQLLQFMGIISCGILMEDGAMVYCSKASKEWRKLCLIEKLDWPANSLDVNPLENVWKLFNMAKYDAVQMMQFNDAVQHGQICPRNLEELTMILEREWRSISSVRLCNLCHYMLARLQLVIEAKRSILVGKFAINPF